MSPSAPRDTPALVAPATTTSVPPAVIEALPSTTAPAATRSPSTTPTATADRPATPAVAPSQTAPVPPARPGTYHYDTIGQSSYPGLGGGVAPYPAVTTLVVDPPAGTHQHATRDLRDASGSGPVVESRFDYRPDGVYLESLQLTVTLLVFSDTQELRPPVPTLVLPTDARPGYSRELTIPGRVAPAGLVIEVVGEEPVRVGGREVATAVIHVRATSTGQFNAGMDLTVWLDRSTGVWVKERSTSEASTPDGEPLYQSQYEATLRSIP
jgi:hypothetical protein